MPAYLGLRPRVAKPRFEDETQRPMARKTAPTEIPTPAGRPATPDFPAPEVVSVHSHRIACDGVGGALGHPRVWLEMGEGAFVECPYCDRRFVLGHGKDEGAATPGVYEGAGGH